MATWCENPREAYEGIKSPSGWWWMRCIRTGDMVKTKRGTLLALRSKHAVHTAALDRGGFVERFDHSLSNVAIKRTSVGSPLELRVRQHLLTNNERTI